MQVVFTTSAVFALLFLQGIVNVGSLSVDMRSASHTQCDAAQSAWLPLGVLLSTLACFRTATWCGSTHMCAGHVIVCW
jgi:hypothetical protein